MKITDEKIADVYYRKYVTERKVVKPPKKKKKEKKPAELEPVLDAKIIAEEIKSKED